MCDEPFNRAAIRRIEDGLVVGLRLSRRTIIRLLIVRSSRPRLGSVASMTAVCVGSVL
jgi:hypothetical protein